jgi:DNA-binding CsgD family transcriptional regulator
MSVTGFIVVVESFLIRKGVVSILQRIPGIRVIREFGALDPFLQFTGSLSGYWIVIGDSLFDGAQEVFQSHPELLERTLLLRENSAEPAHHELHSIYLNDPREEIMLKIHAFLEMGPPDAFIERAEPLSQRERTIVRLVSLGMTNRQIADRLFLSTHTVISHRKNISSKLGIKSVSGLTVYAIVNNIITIEEVTSKP